MNPAGIPIGRERWLRLWHDYRAAFGTTALLLGLSLWIQNGITSSPMTLDESIWARKLEIHLTYGPFAVRYFQSYATLALHHLFGLPIRESFFFIQYALGCMLGPMLYRFLKRVGFGSGWSLVGVVLLMLSYPIIGAHFAPTHTWDDFWSYLFLVLAFSAVIDKRALAAGIYLTLGCLAREQISLFWPLLFWGLWSQRYELSKGRLWLGLLLPPVTVAIFRILHASPLMTSSCDFWESNFGSPALVHDTLVSTLIAFGWLWLLALIGLFLVRRYLGENVGRLLLFGMVTALPATIFITWYCALARETRLMFPPFILIIPLALVALRAAVEFCWRSRTVWLWIVLGTATVPVFIWGIDLAWDLFPEIDYGTNGKFRRDLAGVHFALAALYLTGLAVGALSALMTRSQKKR